MPQKIIVVLLQKRYLFALTRKKLVVNRLLLKARIYKGLGNVSESYGDVAGLGKR